MPSTIVPESCRSRLAAFAPGFSAPSYRTSATLVV